MIEIRAEKPADRIAVYRVNERAFERAGEADLVERLRAAAPHVSLVAIDDGEIVGHIFFSPVALAPGHEDLNLFGLAPMAVAPERQNQGIGAALVERGLAECRALGVDAVFVLGHPEYYPRFGFAPAETFGIGCEYDVPAEAFMALELRPGALANRTGTIRYRPEFAQV